MKGHFAPKLTESHYVQAFSHFRSRSDQRALMLEWFAASVDLLEIPKAAAVLSIGSGTGDFDMGLIPVLENRSQEIVYEGVEPNVLTSLEFEKRFERADYKKTKLNISNCTFEEYQAPRSFDLVHITHSLYYMENKIAAVRKALSLIRPCGRVVVFNGTTKGIQELRRRFLWEARGDEDDTFTSEELVALLDILKLPYRYEAIPSWVDVTECFFGPAFEGRLLLDFILECDTSLLPEDLLLSIMQYLSKMAHKRGGRYFMYHPVGVFRLGGAAVCRAGRGAEATAAVQ